MTTTTDTRNWFSIYFENREKPIRIHTDRPPVVGQFIINLGKVVKVERTEQ